MNRKNEDAGKIVIDSHKVKYFFFAFILVTYFGYVAGRYFAGNPIDFASFFEQLFTTLWR